ncbi:Glyoxalase I, conserved site [Ostreococcus tauri]|uniref:Glyoxalase I, conserved site n=2 Tax=Ostreococcus tauri TaxID=70448 RepID=A0A090M736_OSTTA|nr:Glyoxalase I, conserved site [Ostreococcus tauri]CEG00016.1 Glyoxalase I, conserved site [Ostreococcus tauri]|eukprot:XP_022840156.1 Glyoxalase I, conserved site [Ostreococcus tauri]
MRATHVLTRASSSIACSRARSIRTERGQRGINSMRSAGRGTARVDVSTKSLASEIDIQGVHHVAIIIENLEKSMEFYGDFLGLPINTTRPADKLPYRGAWLMIGPEMIHLMELPNPDCIHPEFRPTHGGRDRHFCIGVKNIKPLIEALEKRGTAYTASKSGRPAIFFRDPDCNTLEVVEGLEWR